MPSREEDGRVQGSLLPCPEEEGKGQGSLLPSLEDECRGQGSLLIFVQERKAKGKAPTCFLQEEARGQGSLLLSRIGRQRPRLFPPLSIRGRLSRRERQMARVSPPQRARLILLDSKEEKSRGQDSLLVSAEEEDRGTEQASLLLSRIGRQDKALSPPL